jgi:glyoxylase-like metal-dependent hydrolase (beta-lactamase superfamily II)
MILPVASQWYSVESVDDRIFCLTEPHVHPIFSANIFLVLGRDADLVIDSGMGIAPLRPVIDALRPDPARPLILFTTHTHVDHIGAAHEFETRLVHPLEAAELADPEPYSLMVWTAPPRRHRNVPCWCSVTANKGRSRPHGYYNTRDRSRQVRLSTAWR